MFNLGMYDGKNAGWHRGLYHAYVRATIIWDYSSINNNYIYTHKHRSTYHNEHPISQKMDMLSLLRHKVKFPIRERRDNLLLTGSMGLQHMRRCSATTWTMYTVIFPIQKFIRISNLLHPTGGWTFLWHRNIRLDPLTTYGWVWGS